MFLIIYKVCDGILFIVFELDIFFERNLLLRWVRYVLVMVKICRKEDIEFFFIFIEERCVGLGDFYGEND